MKKWILRILYAALVLFPIGAIADYTATQGAGSTVFAFVCSTTKICPATVLIDSSNVEKATAGNPLRVDTVGTTTQPVSATALPLPTGAATAAKQPALGTAGTPSTDVISIQGVAGGTPQPASLGSGAVSANAYAAGAVVAGAFVDGWDITQGAKADAAWVSGSGSVISILKNIAGGVAGSIPTGSAIIGKVGIDQTAGQNVVTGTGGTFPATQSGTWTVQPGNTPNTTPWLTTDAAGTTGGASSSYLQPTASDNHANIKNGAGTVYSVHTSNNSATKNYLRLYDAGTGFNGCNSATGLIFGMEIPPSDGGFSVLLGGSKGLSFTTGLSICVTSGYGSTDTTAATATAIMSNVIYK